MKTEQEIEKQIMGINIDTGYRLPKAERMYSEEEVLKLLLLCKDKKFESDCHFEAWFANVKLQII